MNLSQQVCSLELAKKLRELWVKQESSFYYVPLIGEGYQIELFKSGKGRKKDISAFTVAELGEMLPAGIDVQNELSQEEKDFREKINDPMTDPAWLSLEKTEAPETGEHEWLATYGDEGISFLEQGADTSADACAKMLIYLLENNLITP